MAARAFVKDCIISVDAMRRTVKLVPAYGMALLFLAGWGGVAVLLLPFGLRGSTIGCVLYGLFAILHATAIVRSSRHLGTIDFSARRLTVETGFGMGRGTEVRGRGRRQGRRRRPVPPRGAGGDGRHEPPPW